MPDEVEIKAVELDVEIRKITTLADRTCNIVLNAPEYCMEQVKKILDWRGDMARIVISKTDEKQEP